MSVSEDPSFGLSRVVVELNDADNDVTIFGDSVRHAMYITDVISGTALQLRSDYLSIDGRSGNDRIAVAGSISDAPGYDDDEQNRLLVYAAKVTGNIYWNDDGHANDNVHQTSMSNDERSDEGGGSDNPTSDAANLTVADANDDSVIPNSAASAEDMTSDNDQPSADLLGQGLADATDEELAETPPLTTEDEATLTDLDSMDESGGDATPDTADNESPWDQLLANSDFVGELANNDSLAGLSE